MQGRNEALLQELDELLHKQQRLMNIAFAAQHHQEEKTVVSAEEVASRRIPEGSRVYLWKQDLVAARAGARMVFLPHIVGKGPRDQDVEVVLQLETRSGAVEKDVKASALAVPDDNNDFLQDIDGDPFAFDLVHSYTVVRLTLDMYQRDLGMKDWRWQWDRKAEAGAPRSPIRIIAHAGDKCNAVYHRGKRALKFYYYTPKQGKTVYLCRNFGIVAHEAGHAILDALKPELYAVKSGQSGALHESFADLTAIFAVLSQMDMCEDIIAETKGNLRKARYLTAIGEQFADAVRAADGQKVAEGRSLDDDVDDEAVEAAGFRDANNSLKGREVGPNDPYALSNIFTGYVWDAIVQIFQWERDPKLGTSDADTLYRVARLVRRLLITGLIITADVPNFCDLSFAMEKAAETVGERGVNDLTDTRKYKEILARCRLERELAEAGQPREKKKVDLGDY